MSKIQSSKGNAKITYLLVGIIFERLKSPPKNNSTRNEICIGKYKNTQSKKSNFFKTSSNLAVSKVENPDLFSVTLGSLNALAVPHSRL